MKWSLIVVVVGLGFGPCSDRTLEKVHVYNLTYEQCREQQAQVMLSPRVVAMCVHQKQEVVE